jgi:drug/metabolite transporter (DMT)-like permease
LAGYSAFAIADICAKWLVQSYSIYQIISVENAISVAVLLIFAPFFGGMKDLGNRKNWKVHAMRAGLNCGVLVLLTYCYREFPLADVYTLLFTKPFFVTLLALWFFREAVSRNRLTAIIIGFAGVVIAMKPGTEVFNISMLLPLLSAVMIAVLFFSSRFLDKPSTFSLAFFPAIGAGLICLPFAITTFVMPQGVDVWVFLLIGLMQVAGMSMVSLAYRAAASAVVAPFLYVEMIWALVFGWIIFTDVPDVWMLAGAAVIIASGIYLVAAERRTAQPG